MTISGVVVLAFCLTCISDFICALAPIRAHVQHVTVRNGRARARSHSRARVRARLLTGKIVFVETFPVWLKNQTLKFDLKMRTFFFFLLKH